MPRSFSSFRRSVSWPVSALTRLVLPWSMWPAVPMITAMVRARPLRVLAPVRHQVVRIEDGATIQQETAPADATDDRRTRGAEPLRNLIGREALVLDGDGLARNLLGRERAAANLRCGV